MSKDLKIQEAIDFLGLEFINEMANILRLEDKVASGSLMNSLDYKVEKNNQGYSISIIGEKHFIYVDEGRRPGGKMPPIDKIQRWCSIRGIDKRAAFPIAKSIAINGTKGINFTEKTIQNIQKSRKYNDFEDKVEGWIEDLIDEMIKNTVFKKQN
jgi:hypothetical protein